MFYAVIPAGGSGTRLWPLSRAHNPKFLHALTGTSESLLQATASRLRPLATPETTFVVTGPTHAVAVARQLTDVPAENVLVEPSPRDSCPAIGLAAALISRISPDAVMGAFSADHYVPDTNSFRDAVRAAISEAERGKLVAIGMTPTYPETGYGYIELGEQAADGLYEVARFKEKPTYEVANDWVKSSRFLWNASMFVWRVDVFLDEVRRQQPELHGGLMKIADAWNTPEQERVLGEVWPTLPKISVDYAVIEGAAAARKMSVVKGDFPWNDIGDFHTLGTILPGDESGNVILEANPSSQDVRGEVVIIDSERLVIVPHSGRAVALLGVSDLIVVDTEDAVLVCSRQRAQEVKSVVEVIKAKHHDRYA